MALSPPFIRTARSVAALLVLLVAVPLVTGAGLRLIPGMADDARTLVSLALLPSRGTPAQAIALFFTNITAAGAPLAGAALLTALSHRGKSIVFPRALLDAIFGLGAASNAALLTVAITGYGLPRLATWLPHVPLEFGALALSLSLYRQARARETCLPQLALAAGCVLVVVAAAAAVETWATPQT
jgi:hypothetical protein